ncbi:MULTISPECIES: ABC transporter substrate-binding protein [unclassified Micromonospora]|uniref:ABC transporter substrate-binding protein n=1 Tax=unclassified Micromonospora TaxID=2617518 RepID=UPI0015908857|nr:ABC transporter substrate-binding protein [Verrucosispora sp. NA02020]QKW14506.1 ABC transporter substrate-binding protein [Verrucosispora sp. NA02020]
MTHNPSFGAPVSRRSLLRFGASAGLLLPTAGGMTLMLSGCGGDDNQVNADGSLNGSYMTASGLTLSFVETMVAKERGYFAEHGLNLDIKGGQGTATAIQAVLGGSADMTRANGINAIIAVANEDAPFVSIASVRQKSQFEVVSLPDDPIRSPAQLAGRTCGIVSTGGATENLLDVMLINAGIDPGSVQRPVTGVGTAAYELARRGEVDAWICVNTDRATIQKEIGEVVFFSTDEHAPMPSDSYNTSLKMVESDSDMPVRFLAGVLKAIDYASKEENWEQVINDLRKYNPEADAAQARAELPLLVESWQAAGPENTLQMNPQTWLTGQESLVKAKLVNSAAPIEKLIYPDYLARAREL